MVMSVGNNDEKCEMNVVDCILGVHFWIVGFVLLKMISLLLHGEEESVVGGVIPMSIQKMIFCLLYVKVVW